MSDTAHATGATHTTHTTHAIHATHAARATHAEGFQRNASAVASHACTVVEHRAVNARYRYLRLQTPVALGTATRPGQFYQLACPQRGALQPFLLRPMSVYGMGPEPDRLEFLYAVMGTGTRALALLQPGETLDIVGPLGSAFTLPQPGARALFLARGVGLATLAPLARHAAAAGGGLTVVLSAREPRDLMRAEFLRGADADVYGVFDSDGSSAVDAVEGLLHQLLLAKAHQFAYTCGSQRLTTLLQRVLAAHPQVQGEVALEQRMACGMGVCLSCVRLFHDGGTTRFLRVCREGPVFPVASVVNEVGAMEALHG